MNIRFILCAQRHANVCVCACFVFVVANDKAFICKKPLTPFWILNKCYTLLLRIGYLILFVHLCVCFYLNIILQFHSYLRCVIFLLTTQKPPEIRGNYFAIASFWRQNSGVGVALRQHRHFVNATVKLYLKNWSALMGKLLHFFFFQTPYSNQKIKAFLIGELFTFLSAHAHTHLCIYVCVYMYRFVLIPLCLNHC